MSTGKVKKGENITKKKVANECKMNIGIDFGQTNTRVAYISANKKPTVKFNSRFKRYTPSTVAIVDKLPLVGDEITISDTSETNVVSRMKGIIKRKNESALSEYCKYWRIHQKEDKVPKFCGTDDDGDFSIEEMTALLLDYVTRDLIKKEEQNEPSLKNLFNVPTKIKNYIFSGNGDAGAVITVPSSFEEIERQVIRDASAIAEISVLGLIEETTAAAKAFAMTQSLDKELKHLLVFQMGGSSTDIGVFEIEGTEVTPLARAASSYLGGDDFDKNIFNGKISDPPKNYEAWVKLMKACEQAKKDLGLNDKVSIKTDEINIELTKTEFEKLNKPLFDSIKFMIKIALHVAGKTKDQIDEYILVGSGTLIPCVDSIAADCIGKVKQKYLVNADDASVIGAAHYAREIPQGFLYDDMFRFNTKGDKITGGWVPPFLMFNETDGDLHKEIWEDIENFLESQKSFYVPETEIVICTAIRLDKSSKRSCKSEATTENVRHRPNSQKIRQHIKKKKVEEALNSLRINAMNLNSSIELLRQKKDRVTSSHQTELENIQKECDSKMKEISVLLQKLECNDSKLGTIQASLHALNERFQIVYNQLHNHTNQFSGTLSKPQEQIPMENTTGDTSSLQPHTEDRPNDGSLI